MNCDMCGREGELVRASIEGTEINVCSRCAKYGRVLGKSSPKAALQPKLDRPKRSGPLFVVNPRFSALIKQKREELGLKQDELAKAISERESIIHKLETGSVVPGMELAKKLENFLRIRLVDEYMEDNDAVQKGKSAELTLGDFIRVKK